MLAYLLIGCLGGGVGYCLATAGLGPISSNQAQLAGLLDAQRRALDDAVVDQARAVQAVSEVQALLQVERDRREGEQLVESATRQGLEQNVRTLDEELAGLRAQLAFYEQLLPSGPPGTVSIRGFSVSKGPDILHYRVLLMRSGRPSGDAFEGRLQFVAEGLQDGEGRTLNLEPLAVSDPAQATSASAMPSGEDEHERGSGSTKDASAAGGSDASQEKDGQVPKPVDAADTLAVSFVQYQRSQGLLAVPAGFDIRSVTLNVLQGNVVRASRQIEP